MGHIDFQAAIEAAPDDDAPKLIYADWLEEQGDSRGEYIRLCLALQAIGPDHLQRPVVEQAYSHLLKEIDLSWLWKIRKSAVSCIQCMPNPGDVSSPSYFHLEPQDRKSSGWMRLLELIDEAVADGRETFDASHGMTAKQIMEIRTLPESVAKLKKVRNFYFTNSYLIRLPAEIGEMTELEKLDLSHAARLHWFPYELTKCRKLKRLICQSTHLYGYTGQFPSLDVGSDVSLGRKEMETLHVNGVDRKPDRICSLCFSTFEDRRRYRFWTTLRFAGEPLPFLVNSCSELCLARLPESPTTFPQRPHRGGPNISYPHHPKSLTQDPRMTLRMIFRLRR
jgi:uncharacterized protein (TIGR02996 family)